ncbi:MAG: PA2778 family cysteine peptidase [bacterium]|nr:PA2778 family cysteine peptidase [bacterium]
MTRNRAELCRWAILGWLVCCSVLACATPGTDRLLQEPGGFPEQLELKVPFVAQRTDECGPAALAMLLAWSGTPVDLDALVAEVMVPARSGSLRSGLIAGARRRARLAYTVRGMDELLRELVAGHPVLVLQNNGLSWFQVWHYAVVIGYDLTEAKLILHSGRNESRRIPLRTFERTWRRSDSWGLLVLPPDLLPVTAHLDRLLDAVLGLERAQHFAEAERAYEAVLTYWPQSGVAWFGLGNARYAKTDLIGAEQAFRAAVGVEPDLEAAWNNFAQVLAEMGRRGEALAAVRRGLLLNGPRHMTLKKTLREIEKSAAPAVRPHVGATLP